MSHGQGAPDSTRADPDTPERAFWDTVRRALIMIVRAIEKRFNLGREL